MTLQQLIDRHRLALQDESVGMRRSWEDVFRYTLKVFPADTALADFDLQTLSHRLAAAGLNPAMIDGYVRRWTELLSAAS